MPSHDKIGFARSDEVFADAVRMARERADMTQAELAEEMRLRSFDFQQQTIYKIESGKRKVSIGEGVAISDILSVPIEMMIETDVTSLRALAATARSTASDLMEQLWQTAYSLGQIKTQDLGMLRHYVREHDRTLEILGSGDQDPGTAQERFGALLRFQGLQAFGQAWQELLNDEQLPGLLDQLGYGEEVLDEWRTFF